MATSTDGYATPEQVGVGAEIPPYTLPLTVQLLVMEAAVNRDLSPIHHDAAAARQLGAPDMFAGVLFLQALYEATARQWMGPAGRIEAIRFRMRAFNCPGDRLSCRAKVRNIADENGSIRIALEAWTESQRGITTQGEIVVRIPGLSAAVDSPLIFSTAVACYHCSFESAPDSAELRSSHTV
jgi:acyl dehydratase